ncbi:fluoride efflux transporter FluC [Auritidibacter ignavus]|uniref:fluoride efflux transporter FluC n=1 Tax=Auritidibacter ignavus TaxID=678932 RepID=UPI00109D5012|nr:CrcB family protein [Auritidibacter ignavus]
MTKTIGTRVRARLHPAILLAVGLAGVAGAVVRWLVTVVFPNPSRTPGGLTTVPHGLGFSATIWELIVINLIGAFLLGIVSGMLATSPRVQRQHLPSWLPPALTTGFLGSFTTVSAMMVSYTTGVWVLGSVAEPSRATTVVIAMLSGALLLAGVLVAGTAVALWGYRLGSRHCASRPSRPAPSTEESA